MGANKKHTNHTWNTRNQALSREFQDHLDDVLIIEEHEPPQDERTWYEQILGIPV